MSLTIAPLSSEDLRFEFLTIVDCQTINEAKLCYGIDHEQANEYCMKCVLFYFLALGSDEILYSPSHNLPVRTDLEGPSNFLPIARVPAWNLRAGGAIGIILLLQH